MEEAPKSELSKEEIRLKKSILFDQKVRASELDVQFMATMTTISEGENITEEGVSEIVNILDNLEARKVEFNQKKEEDEKKLASLLREMGINARH